jgi:cysteine synthase A
MAEKIYAKIDELIGNTPLVRLSRIEEKYGLNSEIIAKLESFNPAGSAKDRVAMQMIAAAEAEGKITKDTVIIEPTSGNTGIGIAMICAIKGYRAIIVMPSSMSRERIMLMRAYGAEVVLSDASLGMNGAIAKANELAANEKSAFIPSQFDNPQNVTAHKTSTGPEIWRDTDGVIDAFVAGVGTGGTISGVGEYLKEKNPNIKIIAAEPADSAVLSGKKAATHKIQGIGAGFIPKILNTGIYDEVITVSYDDAKNASQALGKIEGVLAGISSGAALYAATVIASRPEMKDKRIVVLLPDTGERYLSCDLFDE